MSLGILKYNSFFFIYSKHTLSFLINISYYLILIFRYFYYSPIRINKLYRIIISITITAYIRIFFLHRVTTHPQTKSWLIVPRTIAVHTCLLIEFHGVEFCSTIGCTRHNASKLASALVGTIVGSIRRIPGIVAVGFPCGRRFPHKFQFIYEHFTKRHILDVLRYLAVEVSDTATTAQVVGIVVELHLLVVVTVLTIVSHDKDTNIFFIACDSSTDFFL